MKLVKPERMSSSLVPILTLAHCITAVRNILELSRLVKEARDNKPYTTRQLSRKVRKAYAKGKISKEEYDDLMHDRK